MIGDDCYHSWKYDSGWFCCNCGKTTEDPEKERGLLRAVSIPPEYRAKRS